jgi:hypothetical protein
MPSGFAAFPRLRLHNWELAARLCTHAAITYTPWIIFTPKRQTQAAQQGSITF